MRTLFFTALFILLGTGFLSAQEKDTVTLTIEVEVTKYNKGSIFLALYNSEETYMKDTYKATSKKVQDGKAVITFEDVEEGTYAFSLFHDVNDNEKLDKNFLGVPKEPYGFSADKKGAFGPPDFDKIKFNLTKDSTVSVSIK